MTDTREATPRPDDGERFPGRIFADEFLVWGTRSEGGREYVRADIFDETVEVGREYLQASEVLFDWVNETDLVSDYEEGHPEEYERQNKAISAFRALLSKLEASHGSA
ncbi:hypothetical protein [Chelatococcus sp.]|uniref:hypothetical protein n=1 Tax=Chelatococcus sp. TaxID=1953771 RepID=UPI001ED43007|nr:hypothetical protein [Chelatococcus sp.]MBX3547452.1 hypothetical protein [Chelatococcus sp.]CAH1678319.1 hypothetical protein CHELA41_24519 [Hyphomicrobiales bacterium]